MIDGTGGAAATENKHTDPNTAFGQRYTVNFK